MEDGVDISGLIGDGQVRNLGTIGGSVANSDPAADYPAAVIALGATIHTQKRSISGDEYFKDLFETALEPGEIITRIDFPVPDRAVYRKFGICRICFRKLADEGLIPGVKKASW